MFYVCGYICIILLLFTNFSLLSPFLETELLALLCVTCCPMASPLEFKCIWPLKCAGLFFPEKGVLGP